jgi:hypothetical protein
MDVVPRPEKGDTMMLATKPPEIPNGKTKETLKDTKLPL